MRKINHKIKTQVLIISLLLIIGLVVSLCAYMVIFQKKTAYAATQNVEEKYETIEKTFIDINEILEKMKNGEVTVSDEQGDLIR